MKRTRANTWVDEHGKNTRTYGNLERHLENPRRGNSPGGKGSDDTRKLKRRKAQQREIDKSERGRQGDDKNRYLELIFAWRFMEKHMLHESGFNSALSNIVASLRCTRVTGWRLSNGSLQRCTLFARAAPNTTLGATAPHSRADLCRRVLVALRLVFTESCRGGGDFQRGGDSKLADTSVLVTA